MSGSRQHHKYTAEQLREAVTRARQTDPARCTMDALFPMAENQVLLLGGLCGLPGSDSDKIAMLIIGIEFGLQLADVQMEEQAILVFEGVQPK